MKNTKNKINKIIHYLKDKPSQLFHNTVDMIKNFIDLFSKRTFGPLYRQYLHEEWPIMSDIRRDKKNKILNAGFTDYSNIYYIASFQKKDKVSLEGEIPDNILFFSLTLYDDRGEEIYSIDDIDLNEKTYDIKIENETISYNSKNIKKELSNKYCIIQRIYRTKKTPDIYPTYLATIKIEGTEIMKINEKNNLREKYSNNLQNLLYKLSEHRFSYIKEIGLEKFFLKEININEFFLPAKSQLSLVFPNHYSDYLIAFPKESKVMKITGKLPKEIGFQKFYRFIGFMACNFETTATDDSISDEDLIEEYTIYVAFSKEDAVKNGYNENSQDKLLLWEKGNSVPVVVFRILFGTKKTTYKIDNTKHVFSGNELRKVKFLYYPEVKCF